MSVSKYVDHVLVLPEDDANTKILNDFDENENRRQEAEARIRGVIRDSN